MPNLIPSTQTQMVAEDRKPDGVWYTFLTNLASSTNKIENQKSAINSLTAPTTGGVIDSEARAQINQIIQILQSLV